MPFRAGSFNMAQVERRKENKQTEKYDKRKSTNGQADWIGFIDVPLNDDDKAAIRAMRELPAPAWETVWDLVEGGYKLSISFDAQHDLYTFSMTAKRTGDVNAGLTLTGRGASYTGAMCSFVHKHLVKLEGDWTRQPRSGGDGGSGDFIG